MLVLVLVVLLLLLHCRGGSCCRLPSHLDIERLLFRALSTQTRLRNELPLSLGIMLIRRCPLRPHLRRRANRAALTRRRAVQELPNGGYMLFALGSFGRE